MAANGIEFFYTLDMTGREGIGLYAHLWAGNV